MFLEKSMDGGAWPFLVRGLICQVNSDNERDLHVMLVVMISWFESHSGLS